LFQHWLVKHAGKGLHLAPVIHLRRVQLVLQLFELLRVRAFLEACGFVVRLEGIVDLLGFIHEIQNEGRLFAGNLPIQS